MPTSTSWFVITGILEGTDAHLDILKTAQADDGWNIGTAEALYHNGNPELHVNVTNVEQSVRDKQDSRTVIVVDVNEDDVSLTALSKDGVEEILVIDFLENKFERRRYFTMRQGLQHVRKNSNSTGSKGTRDASAGIDTTRCLGT